jgi:hypothetical protein
VDHIKYRDWLRGIVNGRAVYGMSTQVLASVIRISTHARAFQEPDSTSSVIAFANVLLGQPHCRRIAPGPDHWDIYTGLIQATRARGPLTQDAWLAALAIEHACQWVTSDKDFGRFPGLRWTLL